MRKSLKPASVLFPEPVCIVATYDKDGNANAMNAAWAGVSDTNEVHLCLSHVHKTVDNILQRKCFTLSCGTEKTVAACDYVGMVSGNDEPNKLKKAGFHTTKSKNINAPIIKELPFALECKLISYDKKTGHTYAKIVGLSVDSKVMTNGKADIKKVKPLIFDEQMQGYFAVGKKVGKAFCDFKNVQ